MGNEHTQEPARDAGAAMAGNGVPAGDATRAGLTDGGPPPSRLVAELARAFAQDPGRFDAPGAASGTDGGAGPAAA